DGFVIGQMISVTGDVNGTFTVANVSALVLTLTPIAGSPTKAGAAVTVQTLSAFTITRTSGTWSATDFAANATIDITGDAGGTFKVVSGGGTATITVSPVGLSALRVLNDASLTVKPLNLAGSNSSGSFLTDGFAVGQELALGPPTQAADSNGAVYDIWENHLTLHSGDWLALGFRVGQQITIGAAGLAGSTWTVKGFAAGNTELELNGPQLDPLPNVSYEVKAVSQYVGIVKAVTKTSITLNLALTVADFPSGPLFPANPGQTLSHQQENITVLNRVGNSAPFFVFPLAN